MVEDQSKGIKIQGSVLYKPSIWVEMLKYILGLTAVFLLIYLVDTRYQGPITLIQFVVMVITGGLAVKISIDKQAGLVKTFIDVEAQDKQVTFTFDKTVKTKIQTVKVENIQDLIVITHLKYIKIINKEGLEAFELSLENLDDLRILSNYIIKQTGAYLVSL